MEHLASRSLNAAHCRGCLSAVLVLLSNAESTKPRVCERHYNARYEGSEVDVGHVDETPKVWNERK